MSLSANYPTVRPSLLLDFANSKRLDPRITFTRATTATYYDGVTTTKAEENLLVQSQTFETTWAHLNTSITANTSVAPDGTTTADTLADNTTTGTHIFNQSPAFIAGAVYTMSVFMKAGTNNFGVLTLTHATTAESGISAVVDLSAGTISQTDTGTSATFTSSSITSVGSGWYRVVITGSSVAGFNRAEIALAPAGTGNTFSNTQRISYTGTGTTILIWGAQLEQRSSVTAYTATTTQSITNYIPTLQTASSGVARFDHNPTTGESLGLLIEQQSTNVVTNSASFSNWTKPNSSFSTEAIAPDGTLTAQKVISTVTGSNSGAYQSSSGATTISMYAKAAGKNWIAFINTAGSAFIAWFNVSTGTVGTVSAGYTATMTSVGNGWYRCVLTAASGSFGYHQWCICDQDNDTAVTANAINGVFVWGAQAEASVFATSYIPTTSAAATRNADNIILTGTNFSSWFNNQEGTFYSEVSFPAPAYNATNTYHFEASDGTSSNRLIGYTGGNQAQLFVSAFGSTQATALSANAPAPNTNYRCGFLYEPNNFALSVNGQTAVTDNSGAVPQVSRLNIAANYSYSEHLSGWMKKLAYYPQAFTTAQLQTLTTP